MIFTTTASALEAERQRLLDYMESPTAQWAQEKFQTIFGAEEGQEDEGIERLVTALIRVYGGLAIVIADQMANASLDENPGELAELTGRFLDVLSEISKYSLVVGAVVAREDELFREMMSGTSILPDADRDSVSVPDDQPASEAD